MSSIDMYRGLALMTEMPWAVVEVWLRMLVFMPSPRMEMPSAVMVTAVLMLNVPAGTYRTPPVAGMAAMAAAMAASFVAAEADVEAPYLVMLNQFGVGLVCVIAPAVMVPAAVMSPSVVICTPVERAWPCRKYDRMPGALGEFGCSV